MSPTRGMTNGEDLANRAETDPLVQRNAPGSVAYLLKRVHSTRSAPVSLWQFGDSIKQLCGAGGVRRGCDPGPVEPGGAVIGKAHQRTQSTSALVIHRLGFKSNNGEMRQSNEPDFAGAADGVEARWGGGECPAARDGGSQGEPVADTRKAPNKPNSRTLVFHFCPFLRSF